MLIIVNFKIMMRWDEGFKIMWFKTITITSYKTINEYGFVKEKKKCEFMYL